MKLFEPLNVGGMLIANRVMVPAMVTRLSGEDGLVNKDITDRYVRYAQGGAGLIVIEAMAVHQRQIRPAAAHQRRSIRAGPFRSGAGASTTHRIPRWSRRSSTS